MNLVEELLQLCFKSSILRSLIELALEVPARPEGVETELVSGQTQVLRSRQ